MTAAGGLTVVPRAEIGAERWDALARESDDAWLWHVSAFSDALATWEGASDLGFGLVDGDGTLTATMPLTAYAFARARGRLRFATVRSLGGPAVAPAVEGRRRDEVRRAAVDAAAARAAGRRGVELDVALAPLAPALRGDRCPRVNPLVELGFENTLTQTVMIDLRGGADEARAGLRDRARGEIKKAERAGVTVRRADRETDVETYYRLHLDTYDRTGAPPHPRAYFEHIFTRLVPERLAVVFVAERDGTAIAARSFGTCKRGALYWTGAASAEALDVGAGALLQWRAIEELASEDHEWFESGEVFPGASDGKSRGLTLHKTSFGGELYPFYRGRREVPQRAFAALESLRLLRSAFA